MFLGLHQLLGFSHLRHLGLGPNDEEFSTSLASGSHFGRERESRMISPLRNSLSFFSASPAIVNGRNIRDSSSSNISKRIESFSCENCQFRPRIFSNLEPNHFQIQESDHQRNFHSLLSLLALWPFLSLILFLIFSLQWWPETILVSHIRWYYSPFFLYYKLRAICLGSVSLPSARSQS